MRIGVDVRALSRVKTGIFRYLRNVLEQLQQIDAENEYILYSDREFDLVLNNVNWRKRVKSPLHFLPGSVWQQTYAKRMAIEDHVDVFWGPAHSLPLGLPNTIRKVVTVHDLVWRAFPETMSVYNRLVSRLLVEKSIRYADVVVADSTSTKLELDQQLGQANFKTRIVQLGVEARYRPLGRDYAATYIAQKFGAAEEYICTVGTIEPRKNLVTLIDALKLLREKHGFTGQLLIAGGRGWGKSNVHRRMLELGLTERNVKFLGFVPEEDMPALYLGALAFVFPSIYEGFGLPVLEAMACGAPVVASNTSSIPEVLGDAGVLVDPHKPAEFADATSRIASDPEYRAQLSAMGLERARLFDWGTTARQTLSAFVGSEATITTADTGSS